MSIKTAPVVPININNMKQLDWFIGNQSRLVTWCSQLINNNTDMSNERSQTALEASLDALNDVRDGVNQIERILQQYTDATNKNESIKK
jgi:hypothetical protein